MDQYMYSSVPKMGLPLNEKQKVFYDFLKSFVQTRGYFPSYKEIFLTYPLKKAWVSESWVKAMLRLLRSRGYLYTDDQGISRFKEDEILRAHMKMQTMVLPLVGLITAGEPIEAIQERKAIQVPIDVVVDPANTYVLKVKGESMIDEGILDGDYVVVQRSYYPKDGDVVVALLDNQFATLKKFYREKGRIRLQPANTTMKPIFVRDVIVQGVVRAVIRKFKQS